MVIHRRDGSSIITIHPVVFTALIVLLDHLLQRLS